MNVTFISGKLVYNEKETEKDGIFYFIAKLLYYIEFIHHKKNVHLKIRVVIITDICLKCSPNRRKFFCNEKCHRISKIY